MYKNDPVHWEKAVWDTDRRKNLFVFTRGELVWLVTAANIERAITCSIHLGRTYFARLTGK